MLRATLTVLALVVGANSALAADLAAHSRIGAIFAEPEVVVVVKEPTPAAPLFVFAPEIDVRPAVAGIYGKPNSYFYRPYYGEASLSRLPYACGSYGYC